MIIPQKIEIKKLDTAATDYSADVAKLYVCAGWLKRATTLMPVRASLENSYCCFGAFDGGEMVGFFRALSDGVSDAYLLDLVVHPDYRRKGVGESLARALVSHLKSMGIEWITCIGVPAAQNIYSKIGTPMKGHVPFRF